MLIVKRLIVTGLRISELTNRRLRDVAPDGGQILVHGKGNGERIVFVPRSAMKIPAILRIALRTGPARLAAVPERAGSPAALDDV